MNVPGQETWILGSTPVDDVPCASGGTVSCAPLTRTIAMRTPATSVTDINVRERGQTVTVAYDYRHRPVTLLTSASVAVMRMG
ncbi:hypothetical protein GCM10022206_61020 [Streptomyces chiangmaiensis]